MLKSVVHYISNDSLAIDQKFGFLVLEKFLALWVVPTVPVVKPGVVAITSSPVPGFEQFLYNSVVGICFEIPLKKNFDFEDAQSFQVSPDVLDSSD